MESTADFEFNFISSLESLARCSNDVLSEKLSHFVQLEVNLLDIKNEHFVIVVFAIGI